MNSKILKIAPIGLHWETQDPFLFCAYHRDEYPAGNDKMGVNSKNLNGRNEGQDFTLKNGWRMYHGNRVPGFPYHPHRGFETITINKEGVVDHSDSLGAKGRFMEGDVQWMTAGKGIQHSEMFPLIYPDKPNPLEIFQVWLNLPKKNKFVNPHFKMLWKEDIPVINIQDKNGKETKIEIIAGELNKTKALKPTPNSWAANPNNSVGIFTIKMEAHAQWTLPAIKVGANRSIYFYKGDIINIESENIQENYQINLIASENMSIENGDKEAYLLLLEGKPINEPVAHHGPFVMNYQEEIHQAIKDYQLTKFGGWPWDKKDIVHPRDKGRFALHADGMKELK